MNIKRHTKSRVYDSRIKTLRDSLLETTSTKEAVDCALKALRTLPSEVVIETTIELLSSIVDKLSGEVLPSQEVDEDDYDITPNPIKDSDYCEYVDLGLPSGTLWATCNVGSSRIQGTGDYLELSEVKNYNAPTKKQLQELINECLWYNEPMGGVQGHRIVGPSGRTIFLPAAGYQEDGVLKEEGKSVEYWTRTSAFLRRDILYTLFCRWEDPRIITSDKLYAFPLRPVK